MELSIFPLNTEFQETPDNLGVVRIQKNSHVEGSHPYWSEPRNQMIHNTPKVVNPQVAVMQ